MKIIRYRDPEGRIKFGAQKADGTAVEKIGRAHV